MRAMIIPCDTERVNASPALNSRPDNRLVVAQTYLADRGMGDDVVQLMAEECACTAPPAADVGRRAIPALARYREPCHRRSIFEIVVTLVPFVALWALAWAAVHFGY